MANTCGIVGEITTIYITKYYYSVPVSTGLAIIGIMVTKSVATM